MQSDTHHPQAHADARSAFRYIDTATALPAAVDAVRGADRIAVDIEANGLYSYFHKVCLLQFSTRDADYIVDPFAPMDLGPLLEAMADTPMVLHAGDYDMRMLRRSYAFHPRCPVFDTMLAAQLLGHAFLGLPKILEAHTGIQTTKSGQKSDWTRRPLSAAQLAYAVDDTRHLLDLADVLGEKLGALGRSGWHAESCARMVAGSEEERDADPEMVWRIKGWNVLNRRALAYLRELWEWREAEAAKVDKPTFKVLSNPQLIQLAQVGAEGKRDPVDAVRLPRNIRGGRLDTLRAAIKRAGAVPAAEWPPERLNRGGPRPKESPLLPELQAACAAIAKELELAPQVIASRATVAAVALALPSTREDFIEAGGLMQWQADLLWPAFAPILAQG